jgi:hypothetical protein
LFFFLSGFGRLETFLNVIYAIEASRCFILGKLNRGGKGFDMEMNEF